MAALAADRDPQDQRPVILMAQDEGRFGRISASRNAWAPSGCRPIAPKQIVREYIYAFAAVCPSLGSISCLILPEANTDMMNLFLSQVAEDFQDYFVIMLVDQAGWHVSKNLRPPPNIRLLPQPPHSPELNPTEHIWDELREKHFHNVAFSSLDHVQDTLCNAFRLLDQNPERIRSLTNFPYMNVTC